MNGDAWKEGSFIDVGPQGMINLDHVRRYEYARDGIAVRHPDGVVSHYKDALTWKDVEEWKKWVREDLRQAEEEKKEAAE
jgi:hypothetical protein